MSALRRRDRQAGGRGDASLPEPALPVASVETLNNWVMAAADIEGVGELMVRRLWQESLVTSIPDLYRLTKEQLLDLDGFGEVSAQNAIDAIAASKQTPFFRVLFGLNIPQVGFVTAQNLARHFGSVDRLAEARGGDPGGRGHRARSGGRDRRMVRRRGEPPLVEELRSGSCSRAARRSAPSKARSRTYLCHHRHARRLVARRGSSGARSPRGEG